LENLDRFDALMEFTCVKMGFCGTVKRNRPLHVIDLIPRSGEINGDQFADLVLIADGMNPYDCPEWLLRLKRQLSEGFSACMGHYTVSAEMLRYNDDPVWP